MNVGSSSRIATARQFTERRIPSADIELIEVGGKRMRMESTERLLVVFFFSSRRRHTRSLRDWSSDVCSSDLSYHAILRLLPYALLTAASNTRTDAFQMSRPVPSPSMNGMIGLSGTVYLPFA